MIEYSIQLHNNNAFVWTRGGEPVARGPNAARMNICYGPQEV